jgi:hypothetical protein
MKALDFIWWQVSDRSEYFQNENENKLVTP